MSHVSRGSIEGKSKHTSLKRPHNALRLCRMAHVPLESQHYRTVYAHCELACAGSREACTEHTLHLTSLSRSLGRDHYLGTSEVLIQSRPS